MTVQQRLDALAVKETELNALLTKADPTIEEMNTATTVADEIKTIKSDIETAKAFEAKKAQMVITHKTTALPFSAPQTTVTDVKAHYGRSVAFKDAKTAYQLGRVLQATFGNSPEAKQYCADNGLEVKTHTSTQNTTGGIFVPEQLSSFFQDLKEQYGVFSKYARQETMTSDEITFYRSINDATAYWGSEAGTLTASDLNFDSVSVRAEKLYGYGLVTMELSEDAAVNLADRFAISLARQFARKEDLAGFLGDGTSTYGNIVGLDGAFTALGTVANSKGVAVCATGHDTYAEVDIADFLAAKRKLPIYARNNRTAWFIHKDTYGATMERLLFSTGVGGLQTADLVNGVANEKFLGYPVVFTEVLPSTGAASQNFAYLGDLSQAATIGVRSGITLSTDMTGDRFLTETIAIKGTQRVGITVHDIGNNTATAANQVAGPIIAVQTAA